MISTLEEITREIATGMLHLPVCFTADPANFSPGNCHIARVAFSGASRGELQLQASVEGAHVLAKGILPAGVQLDADCILDSLGEIANIFAGSYKAFLPPGVSLSPPEFDTCENKTPAPTGLCRFEAGGEYFEVRVYETKSTA